MPLDSTEFIRDFFRKSADTVWADLDSMHCLNGFGANSLSHGTAKFVCRTGNVLRRTAIFFLPNSKVEIPDRRASGTRTGRRGGGPASYRQ
jgi:hypothetical protein